MSASFHGSKYAVSVKTVDQATLRVVVEQVSSASVWKGTFTSQCTLFLPAPSDADRAQQICFVNLSFIMFQM